MAININHENNSIDFTGGAIQTTFGSPTSGVLSLNITGALRIASGTTGQRPTAATGQFRYNTSLQALEYYNGSAWVSLKDDVNDDSIVFSIVFS